MERAPVTFANPPVIETVLGVHFAPIEGWDLRHFGLLWSELRGDYVEFSTQPPIAAQVEVFGRPVPRNMIVEIGGAKPFNDARAWYVHKSGEKLIQVQRDMFLHNWRKESPESEYPRYERIRESFATELMRFVDFLKENELGSPDVQQCEVTYINHLERGKGWESFADLGGVLRCWASDEGNKFLPSPEAVGLRLRYGIPDQRGRLHVTMEHAIRNRDGQEIIQLNLTARGKPFGSEHEQVLSWLDLGREWVVKGFNDLTAEAMHRIWGKLEEET